MNDKTTETKTRSLLFLFGALGAVVFLGFLLVFGKTIKHQIALNQLSSDWQIVSHEGGIDFYAKKETTLPSCSYLNWISNDEDVSINFSGKRVDSGIIAEFSVLGSLKRLVLDNATFDHRELERLRESRLKELYLNNCGIDENSIALLENCAIRVLELRDNPLDDSCVSSFLSFKDLEELAIDGCYFSPAGVKAVESAIPNCTVYVGRQQIKQ